MSQQTQQQAKPGSPTGEGSAPPARKNDNKRTFHVVGPGALSFQKEIHKAGTVLELSEAEAKELGPLVAPGRAPKRVDPTNPGPGTYRLLSAYWREGKVVPPGTELKLDAAEARVLAHQIEPVAAEAAE